MIRGELQDHPCPACRRPLSEAQRVSREDVFFRVGEYAGSRGVALVVRCRCNMPSVVPLSVTPERVA